MTHSTETIQAFRRALVVVSLFVEGQDETVDEEMESLRQDLRKSASRDFTLPADFSARLDGLEKLLRDYESRHTFGTEQLISKVQHQAGALLDQLPDGDVSMTIRTLRKDAGIELQSWNGCRQQLIRWLELFAILTGTEDGEELLPDWKAKLEAATGGSNQDEQTPEAEETEADSSALGQTQQVAQQPPLDAVDGVEGFGSVSVLAIEAEFRSKTGKGLCSLLKRLPIPAEMATERDELIAKLTVPQDEEDWESLLEDVADLVLVSVQTGDHSLGDFLKGLEQHLNILGSLFSSKSIQGTEVRDDLTRGLNEKVEEIRTRMSAWYDPVSVEASDEIQGYLGGIEEKLAKYNESETERERQLKEKLQQAEERIAQLTTEAEAAQKHLHEQLNKQRQKALQDALTGLPNRAAYDAHLKSVLTAGGGNRMSLIIGDVDHFKRINDDYGHQAGDRVLKILANSLRKALPESEFLARIGGEEFVAVIDGDLQQAFLNAEVLRESIEAIPCHFQGKPVPLTMSFGVASLEPDESMAQLFDRADKALYEAKDKGRNRVTKAKLPAKINSQAPFNDDLSGADSKAG
jgi:diguanylate cyclase